MDAKRLNHGLVHWGKYVFAPRSLVPLRFGRRKPYGRFVTLDQMREYGQGRVHAISLDPEEKVPARQVTAYGLVGRSTVEMDARHVSGGYVAEIRGGWCHGRACNWVGLDDWALADCRYRDGDVLSRHFPLGRWNPRYYRHLLTTPRRFPKATRFAGSVVVVNKAGSHNYFHWLSELLPRVEMARRAGFGDVDAYLVDAYKPFHREALERLGIPPSKIIEPHNGLLLQADRLIVPSMATAAARRQFALQLRELCEVQPPSDENAPGRRIYISRGNARTRRLENELALERFLRQYGVESHRLETYSLKKQVQLFADASLVIGIHGAGLVNVMHCRPGAEVIEIMEYGYPRLCYPRLSYELGHHHQVVLADRNRRRVKRPSLHVSLAAMEQAVCVSLARLEDEPRWLSRSEDEASAAFSRE